MIVFTRNSTKNETKQLQKGKDPLKKKLRVMIRIDRAVKKQIKLTPLPNDKPPEIQRGMRPLENDPLPTNQKMGKVRKGRKLNLALMTWEAARMKLKLPILGWARCTTF